jgi:hypothetical protein
MIVSSPASFLTLIASRLAMHSFMLVMSSVWRTVLNAPLSVMRKKIRCSCFFGRPLPDYLGIFQFVHNARRCGWPSFLCRPVDPLYHHN